MFEFLKHFFIENHCSKPENMPEQDGEPLVPINEEWIGPLGQIPRNRAEVKQVFGDPSRGNGKINKKWERSNLIVAKNLPGSWNSGKGRLYCHKLMEPYLREFLARAEQAHPGYIKRLGCFNFRHQQHNPKLPLSYHSWAIALDINHTDNKPIRRTRNNPPPKPFSEEWHEEWPDGIPEEIVLAAEAIGFTWGGRWKRFCDPMHFQLVG